MQNCKICPQMEQLFVEMLKNGAIDELTILNVEEQPELAQQYNIRSLPFYLINDVAFYGLKTATEVKKILQQDSTEKLVELINSELSDGQLQTVEDLVAEQPDARDAVLVLLNDPETSLVVRIGLSAIIETLTETTDTLKNHEKHFLTLADHSDDRIATDAIYYLSLFGSADSMQKLEEISKDDNNGLQEQAIELLEEFYS